MSKLSERVIERLKSRSQKSLSHNKVAFFAWQSEILEAMNEGCSLKAIWETLYEEKKINFKYRAFLRHAYQSAEIMQKLEARRKKKAAITKPQIISRSKPRKNEGLPFKEQKSQSSKIETFEFDPTRKSEDLM